MRRGRHAVLERVAARLRRRSALLLVVLGTFAVVAPMAVRAGTPGQDPANGTWVGGLVVPPGPEQLVLWNLPGSGGAVGTCVDARVDGPLHGPYAPSRTIHDPVYGELNHLFASAATSDVRLAELSALNSRAYDHADRSVQWSYLVNGSGGTSVADANAMLTQAQRLAGPYRVSVTVTSGVVAGTYATATITVRSASGAPVPGARVTLSGSGATPTQPSVITNAAGTATARFRVGGSVTSYLVAASVQSWTDLVEYAAPGEQRMLAAGPPTTQRGSASGVAVLDREVDLVKVAEHDASRTPVAGYRYRITDATGRAVTTVTTGTTAAAAPLGALRVGATYTATEIGVPPGATLYIPMDASRTFVVPAGTGTWVVQAADPEIPAPRLATRASSARAVVGETLTDSVTVSGDDGEDGTIEATRYGPVAAPASGRCADLALASYLAAPAVTTRATVPGAASGGNTTVIVTGPAVTAPGCYGWAERLTLTPSGATASSPPTAPEESTLVSRPAVATVASARTAAPGTPLTDEVTVTGLGNRAASVLAVLYGPLPPSPRGCDSLTDRSWQAALAQRGAGLVTGSAALRIAGDGTYRTGAITVRLPGCYTFAEQLTADVAPNSPVTAPLGIAAESTLVRATPHIAPHITPPTPTQPAPQPGPLARTGTATPVGRTTAVAIGLIAAGLLGMLLARRRH